MMDYYLIPPQKDSIYTMPHTLYFNQMSAGAGKNDKVINVK